MHHSQSKIDYVLFDAGWQFQMVLESPLLVDAGLPQHRLGGLAPAAAIRLLDASAPQLSPVIRDRLLSEAAGAPVTGHVGDHEPLMAIEDAINRGPYEELIISTLPHRVSRWLHLDLVSKAHGFGLPVTHVEAVERAHATTG